MVRSASSVTSTRQRPVPSGSGSPGIDGRVGRGRLEGDPDRPDVVGEDLAEQVVGHLADEARHVPRGRPRPATVLAAEPPDASMVGPMVA